MKRSKIISLIVIAGMVIGMTNVVKVQAKTIDTSNVIENSQNKMAISEVIETIQQNYLKQNEDGTFYIDDLAYNRIDEGVLEIVQSKIDSINEYIDNGQLKFEIVNNGNRVKVINTVDKVPNNIKNRFLNGATSISRTTGHFLNNTYCDDWHWHWYGFETHLDADGCKILKNYLTTGVAATGGAAALAALAPGGQAIAAAMGVASITISAGIQIASDGIDTGRGCYIAALGDPSDATIYNMSVY